MSTFWRFYSFLSSFLILAPLRAAELIPTTGLQVTVDAGKESILSIAAMIIPIVLVVVAIGWIVSAIMTGKRA